MSIIEPIIKIDNLDFAYTGESILASVNLNVMDKDFLAIIGPNGGGKTTLLKLMLGLLTPDKGTVLVKGESPGKNASSIGYVPQNVHINQSFPISALDVVLMGAFDPKKRFSRNQTKQRKAALEALDRLEMGNYANKKIGTLSGGQRQRVLIARALVSNPELLLLDEPTASIDTKGQAEFYELLARLNKEITILVVSHDLLVISRYVNAVACVNKRLHYHDHAEITGDMLETMYSCTVEEECPVELVAHGFPHRVLQPHKDHDHD
ncbi:metal ABC transporter ATP-binding protein [Desulfobacula sp.]|uniref:metal ABC transporter ATP-binding protein n=1 Tax=Desulfobacula sp. TaxID=2593537 RepID=UPI001EC36E09|nr:ABC transporter ATP-binding protein [Desulfobacula sp.]